MSARTTLITFSLLAVLGLAGLLVSATEPRPSTAFSLDVPPNVAVAILGSHQPVCQGPIETTASFGSVIAWISPGPVPGPSTAPPGPAVDMYVNSASGRRLAAGRLAGGYTQETAANFALSSEDIREMAALESGSRIGPDPDVVGVKPAGFSTKIDSSVL